jgi:hypothetical protein
MSEFKVSKTFLSKTRLEEEEQQNNMQYNIAEEEVNKIRQTYYQKKRCDKS